MDMQIWKQSNSDKFSIINVPSYKAVTILQLNGGKVIATVNQGGEVLYWSVQIHDKMIEKTLAILKDLKLKGMKFDDIHDEDEKIFD
jgi:uncharacterized membrane protein